MGLSRAYARRRMEKLSIALFAVVGLLILLNSLLFGGQVSAGGVESPDVFAQASAMPDQGWAPLQVYFSAYGSRSINSDIIRYEWDLDGNGEFDFDATSQRGYAQYLYTKPGEYTITLRVTDAMGRYSTDSLKIIV